MAEEPVGWSCGELTSKEASSQHCHAQGLPGDVSMSPTSPRRLLSSRLHCWGIIACPYNRVNVQRRVCAMCLLRLSSMESTSAHTPHGTVVLLQGRAATMGRVDMQDWIWTTALRTGRSGAASADASNYMHDKPCHCSIAGCALIAQCAAMQPSQLVAICCQGPIKP